VRKWRVVESDDEVNYTVDEYGNTSFIKKEAACVA
jgi:hypothetical protein